MSNEHKRLASLIAVEFVENLEIERTKKKK